MSRYRSSILQICGVLLMLLVLSTSAYPAATITGKVTAVTDGDTIKVLQNRTEVKVRLNGIDCPEHNQAYGTQAKKATSKLCFGKTVTVTELNKDRYGRSIGIVKLPDGKILNEELIKEGLAWWYRQYAPNDTKLQKLENKARSARIGLWKDKNPTPPWDFRRSERDNKKAGSLNKTAIQLNKVSRSNNKTSGSAIVYITRTGAKYHKDGCRSLARSKIPISKADAEKRGYEPCSICN